MARRCGDGMAICCSSLKENALRGSADATKSPLDLGWIRKVTRSRTIL